MELHLKIALACFCGLLSIQPSTSDYPLDRPNAPKWNCACKMGSLNAPNFMLGSNCSSSCDCIPGDPDSRMWNCSCAAVSPHTTVIPDSTCFTACNCTSDPAGTSTEAKKHLPMKGLLVILLLCVILMIIAFLASAAYCFYQKDRLSMQSSQISSEKALSWNSSTNLISHPSASFEQRQRKTSFSFKVLSAIVQKLASGIESERGTLPSIVVQFSYVELEQATDGFSKDNLIGIGGSSNVFCGQLKDGRFVAIKKLRLHGGSEVDSDFLHEIEMISRLNHCHVVPLLGYCIETQRKQLERLLVFQYMPNGNLRDCLDARDGKQPLNWETRVLIALGAARGLEYLHEAAAPRILHRDIKSTNILLDENYISKITDLGMAKQLTTDDLTSCSSSPARMLGTFGYFAPEYAIVGKASRKSDVFSFGVVVLELITGRKPIFRSSNKGEDSLVIWATNRLRDSKLVVFELPDPLLNGKFPEEEMQIMAHLARECLQWDPDSRPTMSEVVQILLTIAPGKSKRRNIPTSFLWSPYSRSARGNTETQTPEATVERQDRNQPVCSRWHAGDFLPTKVERKLPDDHQINMETVLSTVQVESTILLSSNARSWRSSDDEILVDLTEPRFESFTPASMASSE